MRNTQNGFLKEQSLNPYQLFCSMTDMNDGLGTSTAIRQYTGNHTNNENITERN